jgi:hypothetical protein
MSFIQLLVEEDQLLVPFLMHLLPFRPPTLAARLLLNNSSLRNRIPAQLGHLTALTVFDRVATK